MATFILSVVEAAIPEQISKRELENDVSCSTELWVSQTDYL